MAALLGVVIMLIINLMLVLFQKGKADHMLYAWEISQNHIYLRQTNVPYVHKSVSYANSKHVSPPIPDNTNAKFKQSNKAKLLKRR